MLVDFNAASHQVFLNAYEREQGANIEPSFEGKPLSALNFVIEQIPQCEHPHSITYKTLSVRLIDEDSIDQLDEHPDLKQMPDDAKEYYRKIAKNLGNVALTANLRLSGVVPVAAIDAAYEAYTDEEQLFTVSTFKKRPTKTEITGGLLFAQEMLDYTKSSEFGEREDIDHFFKFDMTPDLPLNGHESYPFLLQYRQEMLRLYHVKMHHVDQLQREGADKKVLATLRDLIEKYGAAADRANQALEFKRKKY